MRVRPEQRDARPDAAPAGVASGLDRASLVARFEGDAEFFDEVAAVFIDDCPRMLAHLADARAAGDLVALRQAAHALKGAVGNFTEGPAREAGVITEQLARQGSDAAFTAAAELEALVHALLDALTHASPHTPPEQP
jgi:two-component system, sensor histidine kinase and response regulator